MFANGPASSENIASLVHNLRAVIQASHAPVGFMLEVTDTAQPPSTGDRSRIMELFNEVAPRLAGVALVVHAAGFSGAMLRSVFTMVFMMGRRGFEARIFSQLDAAATWLGPRIDLEPSDIVSLGRHSRERVEPR